MGSFSIRAPSAAAAGGPVGVRGWLLLLVLGLMFLGPIIGASNLNSEFLSAESQHPRLTALAAWGTFKTATWSSHAVFACLSFYAGWGLARGRRPAVVRQAKILLWVIGPVGSIVMGLLVPLLVFGKVQANPQFFAGLLGSIVMAGIWTAYLSVSRRVRATYGVVPGAAVPAAASEVVRST